MAHGLGMPARGGRMWRLVAALALTLGLFVAALGAPGRVGAATTIDIPFQGATTFGANPNVTVGQSITAPATDTVLTSFAFGVQAPGSQFFRGEVYAWDGEKVAGPPLYSSAPTTAPSSGSFNIVTFAIPGGVALAPGGSYALVATTTLDPKVGNLTMGRTESDVYAGGALVYSFTDRAALATNPWNTFGADLQLYATFDAPPPPPATPATPATMVDVTGTATAGGDAVALAASVARQADGAPVPAGGAVTFTYNGATYNATTDAQGVARATAPLPAGTQPGSYPFAVKAAYAGAPGYAASEGQGPLSVATASCSARFADVQNDDPACPAILALVNRGVVYGYATDPPTFGPLTRVQRAQVAAFLVRALGWSERPQGPRSFSDLGPLEGTDLAKAVRIVANACDAGGCVAQGPGDGTFQPTKEVTKAEVIAFLARAFRMDSKYAWSPQPGAPQPHSGVPAAFDTDVRTYAYYAGNIPDAPTTADGWNAPASRAWVARVLYQALATKP